jgi:glycosyltransferase involved in cell wall biosynthesis
MIKVTAIVSLYNSLEYVDECLRDLLEQSLYKKGELEILVIDSNSPQDEASRVEWYQWQYPNIVYHRTARRETLYQAWNRGVQMARGEFITNANSDDRHHPRGLEVMYNALVNNPNIDLVYGDVYESTVANERFEASPKTSRYQYPSYFAPLSLLYYQFGCQPMWRKKIHENIGGFSAQLKAAGDWDFCIRFSLAGLRALHIPEALGSFLNRPTSISTSDSTSVREQGEVKNYYLNQENILALYRVEGFAVDTPHDRARALTDFAMRASAMALPWTPGKVYIEPRATLMSCLAAFEMGGGDPRYAWNLGVSLHQAAHKQEAAPFLEKGILVQDSKVNQALSALQRGEPVSLPFVAV